ncbi:MAG TPA: hypothetical protein VMB21_07620 [Candidatus Limnocylindria bacterium]|nr:hypothetical protein [Candidatus Limnocylindria bacterium]
MAEPFIPLFSASPATGGSAATGLARLNPLAPDMEKQAFVPSLVAAAAPGASHCQTPAGETAQPTVTLHHDGGKVTRIRIHCACGQLIDLDCVY